MKIWTKPSPPTTRFDAGTPAVGEAWADEERPAPRAAGRRAGAAGRRRAALWRRPYSLLVLLPTLLVGIYLFGIAADQYTTEARFLVRGRQQASSSSVLGDLFGSAGFGQAQQEANSVRDYLASNDAVRALNEKFDLVALYRRPEADPFYRLWFTDQERLLRYYRSMVSGLYDPSTGVVTLRVTAFRAEDARAVAEELLRLSEDLVNRLSERAREDALRLGRAVEPIEAHAVLAFHSNGWALGLRTAPGVPVVAHTTGPHRWLHARWRDYAATYRAPARLAITAALPALRVYAGAMMRRADSLLACSRYSADLLSAIDGRAVAVAYPPVAACPAPVVAERPREHVLLIARLTAQKRVEAVLEAFRGASHELVVAGAGDHFGRLRSLAPPNVRFTGWVTDAEKAELLDRSSVLICPSVEEFGIVMAEAHAYGVPVVAPRAGGALEIVDDGRTGVLLDALTPQAIIEAVDAAEALPRDPAPYVASAARFTPERFAESIGRALAAAVAASESTSAPKRSSGRRAITADAAAIPDDRPVSHA